MNGRNAPLSPVSVGGNEWSGFSPSMDKDGPFPNNRGQLASPPNSGGSIGSAANMNGGFSPGPRSAGGPSPPASVGRSSAGTNIYSRSESGRSLRDDGGELILGEHYVVLKRFLSAASANGNPAPPPNKARDKLQRLTPVQFLELSTDVYDELNRRYPSPNGEAPPEYLLPRDDFHPKRNQARSKLSSLPPARFRDLATDVFCEVERRFPRFVGGDIPRMTSPSSIRLPSRAQTPVNGMNGFPPRNASRVRRPSEASSVRSAAIGGYGVSPSLPTNNYERPMAKQSQSNTIVPNKSTMVEEDDDSPVSPLSETPKDAFGITNGTPASSTADKRMVEDLEVQVRNLQSKVNIMEDDLRKKDDELESLRNGERSRATAANLEKKDWDDARMELESRLTEAQNLNDALKEELDRIKDDHADDRRALQQEIDDLRRNGSGASGNRAMDASDAELQRENDDLRRSLREQEQVTEEVRREAQQFLEEMRSLTKQSSSAWEKQTEMQKAIEQLEQESREWKSRYARTKTQLRNLRATSMGLAVDQDAGRYVRERGFTEESGLVMDVHVTNFQMSIDDLLRRARTDAPEKVMESMKTVVVSVRRITKDVDEAGPVAEELRQQQGALKSRVSSTANSLITAAKNFAASAGISPVSLLDAAASHLVAAIVELLRAVKIRPTPSGELDDGDDDGTVTPVDSAGGFFSPGSSGQTAATTMSPQDPLPPPPPFQGFGGNRGSTDSSAYSPINSPRESVDRFGNPPRSNGMNNGLGLGNGYGNGNGFAPGANNKNIPPAPNGYGPNGYGLSAPRDSRIEELKIFVEDQTAVLIQEIQELVAAIRGDQSIDKLRNEIGRIADVVDRIVAETQRSGNGGQLLEPLQGCLDRLLEAGDRGQELANQGKVPPSREWRMWTQTLPPIAFEIARESKELVQQVDRLVSSNGGGGGGGGGPDDFS